MDQVCGDSSVQPRRQLLAAAYREVCVLELDALKPGNVHRAADGHGMTVADFLQSAEVSAGPLTAPGLGLGERIYGAVAATRAAVGCNTNLGIVLLCAPLLQAALAAAPAGSLRTRLSAVLLAADRTDTAGLNRAIQLAAPGGLGTSARHDVTRPATAAPLAVMAAAAHRDRIARQYSEHYQDLFARAVPLFERLAARWQDPTWATVGLYLDFLGRFADTHIARKLGLAQARAVTRRAAPLAAAVVRAAHPAPYREALLDFDRELKAAGRNPGTTADLTVACLLISRLKPLCHDSLTTAVYRRTPCTGPVPPAPVISF